MVVIGVAAWAATAVTGSAWPLILASQELPHSHDCRPSGLVGMILETAWTCPGLGGGGAGRPEPNAEPEPFAAGSRPSRQSPEVASV